MSTKRVNEFYYIYFDEDISAYNYRKLEDWVLSKETGQLSAYEACGHGGRVHYIEWEDWFFSEGVAKSVVRDRNEKLLEAKKVLEKTKGKEK